MQPQFMKLSEAKIITVLDEDQMIQKGSLMRFKYARGIAHLTNMEYSYVLALLKEMQFKGWIKVDMKREGKIFYKLSMRCPTGQAKQVIDDKIKNIKMIETEVDRKFKLHEEKVT